MHPHEVETSQALRAVLADGRRLHGLRIQGVDLDELELELLQREDFDGVVVFGGRMSGAVEEHLRRHGAVVFTEQPGLPVRSLRSHLYGYEELYTGLIDRGYGDTPDALAYAWSRDARTEHDAYATLLRAMHDDSIADALHEWCRGKRIVGVMGGHAVRRGTPEFEAAAGLGARLADSGLTVATGGGPGAMEAANLGALLGDSQALHDSLQMLAAAPDFHDSVDAWARAAWTVRQNHQPAGEGRSLGIPTWFYGHEPPNLFGNAIAKYFSNALREEVLLKICTAGIIVLPGAAGTVQEIFQAVTPLFYASTPRPPMVLVGVEQWTKVIPVWPALQAMGERSPLGECLHLVDSVDEAAGLVAHS